MVKIPVDFDGAKFAVKYNLTRFDFRVEGGELICPSLPALQESDLVDCVVDLMRLERVQSRREQARAAFGGVPELRSATGDQAEAWVEANVTTLASAKRAIAILARAVVALRDETYPDLPDS